MPWHAHAMEIIEETDRRLVIEWRPWNQTWVSLAAALLLTQLLVPRLADLFGQDNWHGPIALLLIAGFWLRVFQVGQFTRLTLDRDTGLGTILTRNLCGIARETVPLRRIDGVSLTALAGSLRFYGLFLRQTGPDGRIKTMVPRAYLSSGGHLRDAAIAIARWLDVPAKTG
jgi:hypothetical protein